METRAAPHESAQRPDPLAALQHQLRACIQCGTCSASCPNADAMDLTPRRLWRLVQLGRTAEIFQSHTFALCSSCYYCTLRCPRGLAPTEAMATLKQIAGRDFAGRHRQSACFYRNFVENIRRHGRVQEMALMIRYFAEMKHPLLPLRFAGLGWQLQRKGKIPLPGSAGGSVRLDKLFHKVEELEGGGPAPERR